jgi:2-polyprenyl-3-methyl-5-hydroxy-6-metoxy-1,4-benzoquinol methylase
MHNTKVNPSKFLVNNIHLLPLGKVLDIAMGHGRNAVYMAKMGYSVEGIDISQDAITGALELAEKNRVEIVANIADLEKGYQLKKDNYDIVICFNYLQRNLILSIKDSIRTGGFVVYETYIIDQSKFGRPKNPEHLLRHNELLRMFQDFRCLRYREGIIDGSKAVAGIVAEKVM